MTDIVNPITPPDVPPVPQRNDEATFEERADAGWEFAFETLPGYMQDAMGNVHQNAVATDERAMAADTAAMDAQQYKADAQLAASGAADDREQTGLDRVQTGLDREQTGIDRVATGNDRDATAADRVQTGLDRQAVMDALESVADGPVISVNGRAGIVDLTPQFHALALSF